MTHNMIWTTNSSPQQCCAKAMNEGRAFVVGVAFGDYFIDIAPGDTVFFRGYTVSYPVLRFAAMHEAMAGYDQSVVLQEPPPPIEDFNWDGYEDFVSGLQQVEQPALVKV